MKTYIFFFFLILIFSCQNSENSTDKKNGNSDTAIPETANNTELIIEGNDIWVRKEPIIGDVAFKLNNGNRCKIIDKGEKDQVRELNDYWYQIEFEGKQGWVFGAQTDKKTGEIFQIKDFKTFLKSFAKDYTSANTSLSPYESKEIPTIQLFNPGVVCSIYEDEITSSRIKSLGTEIYNALPSGDFCEGYPGIKKGFYFEPVKYENLPKYGNFEESGEISSKSMEIPNQYKNNVFQRVQIIFNEYHLAYLYFININEDWYLICRDYCDCSA